MIHSVGPLDVEAEERVGHKSVPKDVPVKISVTLKSRRSFSQRPREVTHDKPPWTKIVASMQKKMLNLSARKPKNLEVTKGKKEIIRFFSQVSYRAQGRTYQAAK